MRGTRCLAMVRSMSKKHHHEEKQEEVLEEPLQDAAEEPEESTATDEPDYYEKYVRLSADFDNFRKRTEREKAALLAYGKKDFVEKLLPAYEVLLRQQANLEKAEGADENIVGGIKMVLGELNKAFKSEGVEKMEVIGKPYDPQTAEAIAVIPASAEQDGQVLEEVQMGFIMDGKVLRPARVVVGKGPEETEK